MIHQIDECCWIKDSYPVARTAWAGGPSTTPIAARTSTPTRSSTPSPTERRRWSTGRYIPNCFNDFVTYVHGTKCAGQFSGNIHAPTSQIYKDQHIADDNVAWKPQRERVNPWQAEWNSLSERHPRQQAA